MRSYERRRQRAMRRPDESWVPYVPAGKARLHIKELSRLGVGHKQVARAAGIPYGSLWKIVYGDPARRMRPSRRIRPETERAILSVSLEDAADASRIPAAPTWRLLNDLIARGFTRKWIAAQLGAESPCLQIGRDRVRAATARKVAELHRRLEGVAAPPRKTRWST